MPGRLLHALFIRIYGAYAHFSGNDETEVLEKVKIFVKPPIRQKSHTALPTQCAVSRSTLSSESKAHFGKSAIGVCFDYARPLFQGGARSGFAWTEFASCQLRLEENVLSFQRCR